MFVYGGLRTAGRAEVIDISKLSGETVKFGATVKVTDEDTGETFNLFRNAGGNLMMRGDSLIIRAGVPARSATGSRSARTTGTPRAPRSS